MKPFHWLMALVFAASTAAAADVYEIDAAHSEVGFKVKHLGISTVPGKFKVFQGTLTLAKPEPQSAKVEVVIRADSIDTGVEARDKHLKSPDFFDAAKYPVARFVSTKISKMKDDRFVMEGKLTMHGVTRPVKLDVEFGGTAKDPWGVERAAFTATGRIDRKDWKVSWNKVLDNGGLMVSDQVDLTLEIEVVKKAPEKKATDKK